jgi:hypothetical protein
MQFKGHLGEIYNNWPSNASWFQTWGLRFNGLGVHCFEIKKIKYSVTFRVGIP